MPHFWLLPVRLHVTVPAIGLIDGNDIDCICRRQRAVAFNDDQVVVILGRCLVAEVVRSGHQHGM